MKKILIALFVLFLSIPSVFANIDPEKEMNALRVKIEKTLSGKRFVKNLDANLKKMTEEQKFAFLEKTKNQIWALKTKKWWKYERLRYSLYRIDDFFDYYDYLAEKDIPVTQPLSSLLPKNPYIQKFLEYIPEEEKMITTYFSDENGLDDSANAYVYHGDNRIFVNMNAINQRKYSSLREKYYSVNQIRINEGMHVFLHLIGFSVSECQKHQRHNCQDYATTHEFLSDYSTISDEILTRVEKRWFMSQIIAAAYQEMTGDDLGQSFAYQEKNKIFLEFAKEIIGHERLQRFVQENDDWRALQEILLVDMENKKMTWEDGKVVNGWEYFRLSVIKTGEETLKSLYEQMVRE